MTETEWYNLVKGLRKAAMKRRNLTYDRLILLCQKHTLFKGHEQSDHGQ